MSHLSQGKPLEIICLIFQLTIDVTPDVFNSLSSCSCGKVNGFREVCFIWTRFSIAVIKCVLINSPLEMTFLALLTNEWLRSLIRLLFHSWFLKCCLCKISAMVKYSKFYNCPDCYIPVNWEYCDNFIVWEHQQIL